MQDSRLLLYPCIKLRHSFVYVHNFSCPCNFGCIAGTNLLQSKQRQTTVSVSAGLRQAVSMIGRVAGWVRSCNSQYRPADLAMAIGSFVSRPVPTLIIRMRDRMLRRDSCRKPQDHTRRAGVAVVAAEGGRLSCQSATSSTPVTSTVVCVGKCLDGRQRLWNVVLAAGRCVPQVYQT